VEVNPNDGSCVHDKYVIQDLIPDTSYDNKILEGDSMAGDSLFTAPQPGVTDINNKVYDNTCNNKILHDQVACSINWLYHHDPNYQTIGFLTGDLVSGRDEEASWQTGFFDPRYVEIRTELANLPIIPAAGNHDGNRPVFAKYFPCPYEVGRY
jgi:hypothetical protein